MRTIDMEMVRAAVTGGWVFACGGGGWASVGLVNGELAVKYGEPRLAALDEVDPEGIVVTVSAIGAPAARERQMYPRDYVRALEMLIEEVRQDERFAGKKVVGTITAQNGGSTTLNGWLQSAVLGLPALDAAGDVRAHPTAKMGSMGLNRRPDYRTIAVAAGGNRSLDAYLEVVARGTVQRTSTILREVAVQSGGFIASARNPLPVSYVKEHAAVGAISVAIRLGEAMNQAMPRGGRAVIEAACETVGGRILGVGPATNVKFVTRGGFDHGRFVIQSGPAPLTISFLNEYMAVDADGERLSTYPDTIATLSTATGLPVNVMDMEEGTEVAVFAVDKTQLPQCSGGKDPTVYPEVEEIMGIELARYALA
ncbi:MAG: DUF917 family protein [Chloroflexi bacterium]|nr:DUF917 family protein [Chloroflexota bacterium]